MNHAVLKDGSGFNQPSQCATNEPRSSSSGMSRPRGFILSYVLLGLAILSVTMMALSRMGQQGYEGKRMAEIRDEVSSQARLIRAALVACTVQYPGGDNGLGFRLQMPATPGSGKALDALCPGNSAVNKTIWPVSQGVFMPAQLKGLSSWTYTHDAASVRITISVTGAGNTPSAALRNVALRLGSQASFTGGKLTLIIAE